MSTDPDRIRRAAQEIANVHLEDAEFCLVYEDDELQDLTEEEMREIHNLIQRSKAVLPEPTS